MSLIDPERNDHLAYIDQGLATLDYYLDGNTPERRRELLRSCLEGAATLEPVIERPFWTTERDRYTQVTVKVDEPAVFLAPGNGEITTCVDTRPADFEDHLRWTPLQRQLMALRLRHLANQLEQDLGGPA